MAARRARIGYRLRGAVALTGLLAMLAPAAASTLYPKKGDAAPNSGVRDARRKAIQGIDISRWQGEIDWTKVKDADTRFAFIKATEGGDHLDPNFKRNWAEAKRVGIPRGAYHFVWWCRPAKDQVRWFKKHIPRDADALPPVLDVEWQNNSACTRKVSREDALEKMRVMLTALHAHTGKKPIIYTDINFHEDVLEGQFNDYPYWLRSTAAPLHHRYERKEWEFWQFTTTGRIPGIEENVDRNAFFGTESEFAAWREGRYDIGLRSWKGEPKLAGSRAPATSAGSKAPQAAGGARLRLVPPGKVPNRTASAE